MSLLDTIRLCLVGFVVLVDSVHGVPHACHGLVVDLGALVDVVRVWPDVVLPWPDPGAASARTWEPP